MVRKNSIAHLSKELINARNKIQTLLESGGPENLELAKIISSQNNISWDEEYAPFWEHLTNFENIHSYKPNIESLILQETKNNSPTADFSSASTPQTNYHSSFPYTIIEFLKLNLKDIRVIIAGCNSSYGNRSLIEVFNKAEYLGKMKGILTLKNDLNFKKTLFTQLTSTDEVEKISVSNGFNRVINYLDNFAYKQNNWTYTYKKAGITDTFSTNPGEQQKRIARIPEEDKKNFLRSLFYFKIISPEHMSDPENNYYDYRMNSFNKHSHAQLLVEMLKIKWNNQDELPILKNSPKD